MSLELDSEWIPGSLYEVVCEDAPGRWEPDSMAPLYALTLFGQGQNISSDMHMRLKAEARPESSRQPYARLVRQPIHFGDHLLFIEEVRDMRFGGQDQIYYESYKKVLVGSKVLWLGKLSGYESSAYVRFKKLELDFMS